MGEENISFSVHNALGLIIFNLGYFFHDVITFTNDWKYSIVTYNHIVEV